MSTVAAAAHRMRHHIPNMGEVQGQGYVGQALGVADLLAAVYRDRLRYRTDDPHWPDRDRFLLSTGHYAIARYAALAEAGTIDIAELETYGSDNSRLPMSGIASYTPGMEISGGSLGHGLTVAVGMALGLRRQGSSATTGWATSSRWWTSTACRPTAPPRRCCPRNRWPTSGPPSAGMRSAAERSDVVGLTADLGRYTDMHVYAQAHPDRYFQLGMAEQLLLGTAAGMEEVGLVPFASTYSVFATRRAYDFLCPDIAEPGLNVNVVGGLPGLTTGYGPSHQATEDIAILRGVPGLTIVDPCDSVGARPAPYCRSPCRTSSWPPAPCRPCTTATACRRTGWSSASWTRWADPWGPGPPARPVVGCIGGVIGLRSGRAEPGQPPEAPPAAAAPRRRSQPACWKCLCSSVSSSPPSGCSSPAETQV
ncbi:hypothetical protein GCM10011581_16430 [Saccharopolyspora subtropica]|uniref:Transketolase-like pyrimidine-binding domain-containing protein n=2 Tax=Saccharopolyspora thermophila TaxID=89367 RepID=A0A917N975_9PSEU|nr:hypothetical protein [Saccharopolyspora subtropica]GGI79946.1 hypothetical protein GCM10011581_16430 [Saccharopolyspora subtropica]